MTQREFESQSNASQLYEIVRANNAPAWPTTRPQFESLSPDDQRYEWLKSFGTSVSRLSFLRWSVGQQLYAILKSANPSTPITQRTFESWSRDLQFFHIEAALHPEPSLTREAFQRLTNEQTLWQLFGASGAFATEPPIFELELGEDILEQNGTFSRASSATYTADEPHLFQIKPGDSLAGGTFSRASTATFLGSTTFFDLKPDSSLTSATFTRAGTATFIDEEGVLRTKATGQPRNAHYINGRRTILLEGQRTNLLLQSQDFTISPWNAQPGFTVTPNTSIAPDGTITAERVVAPAAGANSLYQILTGAAGTYTLSLWVKATAGTSPFRLRLYDNTVHYTPDIVATGTWQRITLTSTLIDTPQIYVSLHSDEANNPLDIQIWGAQLEVGQFASSYIPTGASSVTRAADQLTFPFTDSPQEQTIYVKGVELGSSKIINTRLIQLGGFGAPCYHCYSNGIGSYYAALSDLVGFQAVVSSPTVHGEGLEYLARLTPDWRAGVATSINGGLVLDSGNTAPLAAFPAWNAATLTVGWGGSGLTEGFFAFERVTVSRGIHDMAYFRNLP